jgi:hypothetical protein
MLNKVRRCLGGVLFWDENDYVFEEINPDILNSLTNLERNFKSRLPLLTFQQHEWMRKPLAITFGEGISRLSVKAMKLFYDTTLKIEFEVLSLPNFWIFKGKNTRNSHN